MKKQAARHLKNFLKILGPGLITGASDDDPSGIATYSQAGAQFGLATLWIALLTFPLMATIQEICARIGMVTSQGLTGALKKHYPKSIVYLMVLFSFPAIVLNIGADIAGMGAVSHLLFPSIHAIFFSITFTFTFILLLSMIYLSYQKLAAVLKYLCIILLVYLMIPLFSKPNFLQVLKNTFIPTVHLNKDFLKILLALFGTTISPYLFFWQATMEVENMKKTHLLVDKKLIHEMKIDVSFGMLFSNVVMYFIILSTGTVLFSAGIHQIDTVE
jgi:NRAMP (natural resistance-associated macrophage protein)-like metal ion transporter